MAFDNSLEFVNDEIIRERLDTKINFSNPYTSWKREINELIKRYSLRGPEFNKVSNRKINFFANGIKNRNGEQPNELFKGIRIYLLAT